MPFPAIVAVAAIVIGAFVVLTTMQRLSAPTALVSIITVALLIPTFGPAPLLQALAVGGSLLVAILAFLRSSPAADQGGSRTNVALLAYLVYSTAITALSVSLQSAIFVIATGLLLVCVAMLARRSSDSAVTFLSAIIGVAVIAQAVLGSLEVFAGMDAVWPRPDGTDRIESRPNRLAPWLDGRVLGSLSAPIPYGALAGIGLIVAAWMIIEHRRRRYWIVLAASALALLLSGTRSAMIGALVVLGVWIVVRKSRSRVLTVVFVAVGLSIFVLTTDPLSLVGLDDFEQSTSFAHRTSVLASVIPILTEQDVLAVLFGTGDNARELITTGVVQSSGGVLVFDNQLVRSLASFGVVGTLLLLAAVIQAVRRGDGLSRLILFFVVIMFFSFDALTWRVIVIPFVIVCVARTGGPRRLMKDLQNSPNGNARNSSPLQR